MMILVERRREGHALVDGRWHRRRSDAQLHRERSCPLTAINSFRPTCFRGPGSINVLVKKTPVVVILNMVNFSGHLYARPFFEGHLENEMFIRKRRSREGRENIHEKQLFKFLLPPFSVSVAKALACFC